MVDDGKSGKLTEVEEVRVENDDKTFILELDPAHQEIANREGTHVGLGCLTFFIPVRPP